MTSSQQKFDIKHDLQKSLKALDAQRKALETEAEAILSELNAIPIGGGEPIGLKTPLVDDEGYPRSDIDIYRARHLRNRFHELQTDHKRVMAKVEDGLKKLSIFANPNNQERDLEEQKARMAPKPKPKFDPISGSWVVNNWDGTVSGISGGHLRSFNEIPRNIANLNITTVPPDPLSSKHASGTPENAIRNNTMTGKADETPSVPFAVVDGVADNSPASNAGLKEGDLIVKFGSAISSNHRDLKAIAELVPLAAGQKDTIPIIVLRNDRKKEEKSRKTVSLNIRPQPWSGRGLVGCHIKPYTL